MPPSRTKKKGVVAYTHKASKRINNPPVGLVSTATDAPDGFTKYQHDPHIDPFLSWAGKAEGQDVNVRNVSLHVHERVDPQRMVAQFLRAAPPTTQQQSIFESPEQQLPLHQAVEFYRHEQDWTNRLIAGDSLLVMNSLLEKEGMAGKVQMVYIDPPYGIKYNSNFQPFVGKRDVKDRDSDLPTEPETIKAFRDTWELGIHSYLSHLRDRLLIARQLLHESGSCFVQISDGNVHHVREILDEVFGQKNFLRTITFVKTTGKGSTLLDTTTDYILWFAKDATTVRYRQLFGARSQATQDKLFTMVELPDGTCKRLSDREKNNGTIPDNARKFKPQGLYNDSGGESARSPFVFGGRSFTPPPGYYWRTNRQGMETLVSMNRLVAVGNTLSWKQYEDDFPLTPTKALWLDTMPSGFASESSLYVVQTSTKVIQRCILMTTDPGDLVFDPTCGSGTTAYVAEQWGRRWITCDTSRVATTLAKQRLMTAKFPYYELAHPEEGIRSGFKYKTVPHVTLKSIANNEPPQQEILYDRPKEEKNKVRVTGPFTVEAVPSLQVKPIDGESPKIGLHGWQIARSGVTADQALWREELYATGVRATGGKSLAFSRVEPLAGVHNLHATATIAMQGTTQTAVVSFGPNFGPLEQRQVEGAIAEARGLKPKPDLCIFAAFHFDPEAAKDIDEISASVPGMKVLKAQMNADLLTLDLRKKRSSDQSYWLIGQPDVSVEAQADGTYRVEVRGFDYYNPASGEIESGGTKRIAMWMLDTDYDEQSLFPEQVFFPMNDAKRDWTKLAKTLNGAVDEEKLEAFVGTQSLPFKAGERRKIAVKIVDDRGIESFVVKQL